MTQQTIPTFLVGTHRSGTTLLGLILDSHPDVSWFHHFEWVVSHLQLNQPWPSVPEYCQVLREDYGFKAWNLTLPEQCSSYPEAVNNFLEQRSQAAGKPRCGATVHTRYPALSKLWPQARFIHMTRDPRDVAASVIVKGWAATPWHAAKRWRQAEELWDQLAAQLPDDRKLVVRFEDLVSDPVTILHQVADFMEIPYTEDFFNYTQHTPYGYPDGKMASKWKKKMDPKDAELVELSVGDMLEKRGYERTTQRTQITKSEQLALYCKNRWTIFSARSQRYGFPLWLAQFASRKLGNPAALDWAVQKTKQMDFDHIQASEDFIADPSSQAPKA